MIYTLAEVLFQMIPSKIRETAQIQKYFKECDGTAALVYTDSKVKILLPERFSNKEYILKQ